MNKGAIMTFGKGRRIRIGAFLAAGYAESGQYDEAIHWQQKALKTPQGLSKGSGKRPAAAQPISGAQALPGYLMHCSPDSHRDHREHRDESKRYIWIDWVLSAGDNLLKEE